jgi:hypothetical protein
MLYSAGRPSQPKCKKILTKVCPKSGIKKAVANWQKMPRENPKKDLPSL